MSYWTGYGYLTFLISHPDIGRHQVAECYTLREAKKKLREQLGRPIPRNAVWSTQAPGAFTWFTAATLHEHRQAWFPNYRKVSR